MPIIIQPKRWSMKPPVGARLNGAAPIVNQLYGYWPINEGGGLTLGDLRGTNNATLVSAPWGASPRGPGVSFSGSASYASIALDLSDAAIVTVGFWMRWTTFANDDALAMEFTANGNTNNGALLVDPNASGSTRFEFQSSKFSGSATYWSDSIARPSAGVWHHYALVIDRATPVNRAYVDGISQTLTTQAHTASAMGNFANSTLYLFSRGGASLFGNGSLSSLAIWKRGLSAPEAQQLYVDPYCMFAQQPRMWVVPAAAAAGSLFTPSTLSGIGSGGPFFGNPLN